jgi:serine protease AprX
VDRRRLERQRLDRVGMDRIVVGAADVGVDHVDRERVDRETLDRRRLGRPQVDRGHLVGRGVEVTARDAGARRDDVHLEGENIMSARFTLRSLRTATVAGTALALAVAMLAGMPAGTRSTSVPAAPAATYLVRAVPGELPSVTAALRANGADVVRSLAAVDTAVVRMTGAAADAATHVEGVARVVPDARVKLAGDDYRSTSFDGYDPSSDPYSMYTTDRIVGATDAWSYNITGRGVAVALLDSGIAPVDGLNSPGQVVNGPDLSFDSQNPDLAHLDTFGHGTHMAGIIAGRDDVWRPSDYAAQNGAYLGVAPDAKIVNVKLADSYGATDVSQVIAGIDWVVQHQNSDVANIRVINLSFGTDAMQPAAVDPLAYAAEVAWKHGIVVVVSAGNNGPEPRTMTDPAIDPWVIAVGADDAAGTRYTDDDTIADFSSRGDGTRNPDVVAPGVHVQGLRVLGSQIDDAYGAGAINERFLRGSGTSQAAAVVSGAVARLLQQRPWLTPDQVKALLMQSARSISSAPAEAAGAGLVNLRRAIRAETPDDDELQSPPSSTGGGSIAQSRGKQSLSLDGTPITGDVDIFGGAYDAAAQAQAEADGTAWDGGTWNGRRWAADDWSSDGWDAVTWESGSWAGTDWTGTEWSDGTWTGRRWADATWQGRRWAGSQWASGFSGRSWAVDTWN